MARWPLSASLDALTLWNLRTGSAVATMRDADNEAEVSSLAADASGRLIASGYHDGQGSGCGTARRGRCAWRSTGTALRSPASPFSADGQLLASGSHDTDIIVWDCVAESGMFPAARAQGRGHRGRVPPG